MPGPSRLLHSLTSYTGRVVASIGMRGTSMGLQFVTSILTARLLGLEGFGIYTYAFVWVTLLGGIAHLGFAQLTSRELPRYISAGDGASGWAYVRFSWAATLLTTVVIAAGLAGAQAIGMGVPFGWELMTLGVALNATGALLSGSLGGLQRILQPQVIELVVRPLVMFGGLGAMVLLPSFATPMNVYLLSILASAISLSGAALLLRGGLRAALPKAPAAGWTPRKWLTGSLAILATAVTAMLMTNLDTIMIGAMTTAEEVGRYRAAARGVALILIITGVAIHVMGPMLAKAFADGRLGEARGLITRASATMSATALPLCAMLGIGAPFYLALFGPEFVPATTAMRILVFGQMVAAVLGPGSMALVMMGRERLVLALNLVALSANLAMNWVLIPNYGMNGAAAATLVSLGGLCAVMAVMLRREGYDPTILAPVRATLRQWRA